MARSSWGEISGIVALVGLVLTVSSFIWIGGSKAKTIEENEKANKLQWEKLSEANVISQTNKESIIEIKQDIKYMSQNFIRQEQAFLDLSRQIKRALNES